MPLDNIHVGDTDAFLFDFSAWFATIDSARVTFASTPAGWTFSGSTVSAAKATVDGTAPTAPGVYTLQCTATDGTARVLTLEQTIQVIL